MTGAEGRTFRTADPETSAMAFQDAHCVSAAALKICDRGADNSTWLSPRLIAVHTPICLMGLAP